MGFNATTAVEPLDFDFTTLANCPDILADAKGTIPEPSMEAMNRFRSGFFGMLDLIKKVTQQEMTKAKLAEDTAKHEAASVNELVDAWHERLDDSSTHQSKIVTDAMTEWMLIVCAPVLTGEQLLALPVRVRTAFMGWLVEELIDPKGSLSDIAEWQEESEE